MPRKHTVRDFQPNKAYHIYNSMANDFPIFRDNEDFNIFTQYLNDYLTPPLSKEDLKITVEFKGKKLTGIPRQPNNYHGDLQLWAFCITPQDFHLVLYQDPSHAVAKFMQSITTRYSMYFNKRHGRSGSPFRGKYKAIELENLADTMHLSRYLHRKSWQDKARSSYPDYLLQTKTPWLTMTPIMDFFYTTDKKGYDMELLKQFTENESLDSAEELGDIRLDT